MRDKLIAEIQSRLLRYCELTSVSKITKKGVLHIFVSEAIHLGYIYNAIKDKNPDDFYVQILEDLSRNWQRFSSPIHTRIQLGELK